MYTPCILRLERKLWYCRRFQKISSNHFRGNTCRIGCKRRNIDDATYAALRDRLRKVTLWKLYWDTFIFANYFEIHFNTSTTSGAWDMDAAFLQALPYDIRGKTCHRCSALFPWFDLWWSRRVLGLHIMHSGMHRFCWIAESSIQAFLWHLPHYTSVFDRINLPHVQSIYSGK